MTVDRGGLEYTIETKGDFRAIDRLKKDLKDIQSGFKETARVSKASKGPASKSSAEKSEAVRAKKLTEIQRKQLEIQRKRALLKSKTVQKSGLILAKERALNSEVRRGALLENRKLQKMKQANTIKARSVNLEQRMAVLRNKGLTDQRKELSIQQAIAKYVEKQAKFSALANYAKKQGLVGDQSALADLGFSKRRANQFGLLPKETLSRMQIFRKEMKKVAGFGNRAAASIQRMVTALAFFTLARQAVQFIRQMVVGIISFNSKLELVQLGMAALIISTNKVTDAEGRVVKGAESLAIAQKEARRQTSLLRKESLQTAATFEQLAETFQTAVAPGAQAGFDLDETRKFTVLMSKAASAIGLAQNQMAEEIRSLLQGTIQARTTRIATALGITNEDIKKAKQLGTLFDFVTKRLHAFKVAGKETLNTFEAIRTNLIGAFQMVAGEGGLEFFESLKATFKTLTDQLVVVDSITKELRPHPDALKAFKEFGAALLRILDLWKSAMFGSDLDILGTSLRTIATMLEVISGFLLGIVDVLKTAGGFLTSVSGLPLSAISRVLGQIAVVAVLLKVLPFGLILSALSALGSGSVIAGVSILGAKIKMIFLFVAKKLAMLLLSFATAGLAMQAVIAVVAYYAIQNISKVMKAYGELKSSMEDARGGPVKFGEAISGVMIQLEADLESIWVTMKKLFDQAIEWTKYAWQKIHATITAGIGMLVTFIVNKVFGALDTDVGKALLKFFGVSRGEVEAFKDALTGAFDEAAENSEKAAKKIRKNITDIGKAAQKEIDKIDLNATKAMAKLINNSPAKGKTGADQDKNIRDTLGDLRNASFAITPNIPIAASKGVETFKEDLKDANEELRVFRKNYAGLAKEEYLVRKNIKDSSEQYMGDANKLLKEQTEKRLNSLNRLAKLEADTKASDMKSIKALIALEKERVAEAAKVFDIIKKRDRIEIDPTADTRELKNQEKLQRKIVAKKEREMVAEVKRFSGDKERQDWLIKTASKRRKLQSEIAAAENLIKSTREGIVEVSEKDDKLLESRLTKLREEYELKTRISKLEALQASALARLEKRILQGDARPEDKELLEAKQRLELERAKLKILSAQKLAYEDNVIQANNEAMAQKSLIDLLAAQEERLRIIADDGMPAVGLGLTKGFEDALEKLPGMFEAAFMVSHQALTSFASTISGSISDALDPNKDSASIKERWKKFAKDLASNILEQTIKAYLKKAFISLGLSVVSGGGTTVGSTVGGTSGGTTVSLAEGGPVNGPGGGVDSGLFEMARPSNVDPRDTVPAFLRPGEFVLRPEAVKALGVGFVSSLNNITNPMAALPGLQKALRTKTSIVKGGAAAGGYVNNNSGISRQPSAQTPTPAPTQTMVPILVGGEEMLETLLNSGPGAFRNAMRKNQDSITRTDKGSGNNS